MLVFIPLLENNKGILEKHGRQYYQQLAQSTLEPDQKKALLRIFFSWFLQRFPDKNGMEVQDMLEVRSVKETAFYKGAAAEGRVVQIKEQIEQLESFFKKGFLPEDVYRREVVALKTKLAQLERQFSK